MYFIIQKWGHVGMRLSFYFMFSFFLVPFIFLQKEWTGGQVLKLLKILIATVCISLFRSVDMWTKSCHSISLLFLYLVPFCFLQKVWTGGQAMKILKFLMAPVCISLFKSVDMWTKSCLPILFYFLYLVSLFSFWQRVWTGGQALKLLKIFTATICISLFKSVDLWTRICLCISFLFSTLYPLVFGKKCGQVDSLWKFWKFLMATKCDSLFKSVDMWTRNWFFPCFFVFLLTHVVQKWKQKK